MDYATEQAKMEEEKAWEASGIRKVLDQVKPAKQVSELIRRSFSMGYFAGRIKHSMEAIPSIIKEVREEN